jgi:hypothetical protein
MTTRSIAHVLAIAALASCIPMAPAGGGGSGGGGGGGYAGDPNAGGGGGGTVEPPPGGGGGGAPPAGPVSVTIRSQCPQTVRVFYGDKPKFGSGTNSTISSNSVNSHTFQPGDMFWIIDDSENGLDSVTVDDRVGTIEINRDCTSMSVR